MNQILRRAQGQDHFYSYDDMAKVLCRNEDFRVVSNFSQSRDILAIAIHGGLIEPWTSDIAALIAGDDHGFYTFEGLRDSFDYDQFHLTSNYFDEPVFGAMVRQYKRVVSVHGCRDAWGQAIMVGGLDVGLVQAVCQALIVRGIEAVGHGHAFPATDVANVCNRGLFGAGVQLEIPRRLRKNPFARRVIAHAVRSVL